MPRTRALRVAVLAASAGAVAIGLSGCGHGEDRPGTTDSASASTTRPPPAFSPQAANASVDAKAVDYAYEGLPTSVKGPNVFFTVANAGHTEHEFEVVGADGEPVGEIAAFGVGETKTLAVVLVPGSYTIQCLIKEGSKTHAELGMKSTLTVE
ncbi:MAG: hypothetical protein QOK43_3197 [Acidimicrobiaceae bacterium]|nr:hypothetical protein [Acidimicrobiaceae bacterium]